MFNPCGVITLTTDFGHRDPFVGIMKGVILGRFAAARIVDLTHEIAPQQVGEAAFWLSRSYRYFPTGTVHVAVVDPGVGSARRILAHATDGHLFLAPDNGLLAPLRTSAGSTFAVSPAVQSSFALPRPSATFHGRDIFSPIAAALAGGRVRIEELGPPVEDITPLAVAAAVSRNGRVDGQILTVDRFGNLITNIDRSLLVAFRRPSLILGKRSFEFVRTYSDAAEGEYRALINAFEVVELACRNGDAAQGLGVGRGTAVSVKELEP